MSNHGIVRFSLIAGLGAALLAQPAQAAGWLKNIIQVQQPAVQVQPGAGVQVQQPAVQVQQPAVQVQQPAVQVQQPAVPAAPAAPAATVPAGPCEPHDFSMAKLAKVLKHHGDYLLIDVRNPGEFAGGHIPHAINLPLGSVGAQIQSVCPDRNRTIYVYCQGGVRSARAAAQIAGMGYGRVYDCGGINSWEGKVVSK